MSRTALKFPRRVRIHGGEFDESARAIHREDGVKTIQAESGIVLGSTIERKQMSTKTTFKRVALVAVAALGFGVMSVAPSSAAVGQADTLSAVDSTKAATVGTAVTNLVTSTFIAAASGDTSTMTVSLVSSPATSGVLPSLAATSTNAAGTGLVTVTSTGTGRITGTATLSLNPDVPGVYVVKVAPHSGANAAAITWTVTAVAVDNTLNVAKSTSFLNTGETITAVADASVVAAKTLVTDAAATIVVTPLNAAGAAITAVTLSATVSGPGSVRIGADLATATASPAGRAVTASTAGHYVIGVFADGTAGVSEITIKSGTTVVAVEKVTFYGAATTITPTVVKGILNNTTAAAGAITAIVTDAAGVPVYNQAVSSVSDTAATIAVAPVSCGSSDATGLVSCTLTGVAAGTAGITLTATNTDSTVITSASKSVRVSNGTATTVVYSFDKATYAPGETAKIKATVSNAAGLMPAGTYTATTAGVTGNYSIGSSLVAGIVTVGDTGAIEYSVVMPTGVSGTVQLTGTAATGYTVTYGAADVVNEALDAALEAIDAATDARQASEAAIEAATDAQAAAEDAVVAADLAAEAAVEAGEMAVAAAEAAGAIAQDALDAAIAATDAANDALAAAIEAKDAADAATTAATAAGAAVEALSTKVATLIAGLNAKVTTLSNLLAKIAKKLNVK